MALIPCTCKCKYNATLLSIDIMLFIAISIIGFGIFDIYYATAIAEYNLCTLTKIKAMLITAGCIYIFIGTCITVECINLHVVYSTDLNDSLYDKPYIKFKNIIIPISCMLFCIPAIIDVAITILIGIDNSCHDTPYILLMINLYVVGLLPLIPIMIAAIATIIYKIYYSIKCGIVYLINNATKFCCFEIYMNSQPELPMFATNFESKC